MNKDELIHTMNSRGAQQLPFFFLVNYQADEGYVIPREELDPQFIRFSFHEECSLDKAHQIQGWNIQPIDKMQYARKFAQVQEHIRQGNSYLTNLTQPTQVMTDDTLEALYAACHAKYKVWLKDQFLVLSPEPFIQIREGTIYTFPMKGTIEATHADAERTILQDKKEKAEHATIVDLLRNDISMVAEQVEVTRYRYVERIKTLQQDLLQVSSEIRGKLPGNYQEHLGDILFALLPAGSICGAPKPRTLRIIEEVEAYDRGYYTGVCGYYDGRKLDTAVMIRFLEQTPSGFVFKSGGGITAQSELDKEYNELIQKVYVPVS